PGDGGLGGLALPGDLGPESLAFGAELLGLRLQLALALDDGGLAGIDLGRPRRVLLGRRGLLREPALQLLRPGLDVALAFLEELGAGVDAGARLRELALALGERLLAVAELLLVGLDALLAPGERPVARLGAGRRLARLALERRLGALDLLVASGDRARLLREVLGGARALLVGRGQLAELRLDVLLALRGMGLQRRELVVLLHEPPPLELERLHLLGDVALALLEGNLEGAEPAGPLVELGLPGREVVLGMELPVVRGDLLAERAAKLLLARERRGQLAAERLQVGVREVDIRSRGDAAGCVRRGGLRAALSGRRLPTTLQLGAQTCTEALLGLCDVLRCEFRHAARLPKLASAAAKRRRIPRPRPGSVQYECDLYRGDVAAFDAEIRDSLTGQEPADEAVPEARLGAAADAGHLGSDLPFRGADADARRRALARARREDRGHGAVPLEGDAEAPVAVGREGAEVVRAVDDRGRHAEDCAHLGSRHLQADARDPALRDDRGRRRGDADEEGGESCREPHRSRARRSSTDSPSCGAPPGPLITTPSCSTTSRGSAVRYSSLWSPPRGSPSRASAWGSACCLAARASSRFRRQRPNTGPSFPEAATLNPRRGAFV